MTRNNVLYLVIGALAVAVAVLSYQLYQDREPRASISTSARAACRSRANKDE